MIITICGETGSGKSTVGRELARRLGYKYYDIGEMRGKMAREWGMTLAEFNKLGETEDFTDRDVDRFQEELGRKEDNLVIVGRTSAHFIPHSFKVFLGVDPGEGARRVFQDSVNREDESYSSIEEARKEFRKREESDRKRYTKYYNFNPYEESVYDLVVDTTHITAMEVVERVLTVLKKAGKLQNGQVSVK